MIRPCFKVIDREPRRVVKGRVGEPTSKRSPEASGTKCFLQATNKLHDNPRVTCRCFKG